MYTLTFKSILKIAPRDSQVSADRSHQSTTNLQKGISGSVVRTSTGGETD